MLVKKEINYKYRNRSVKITRVAKRQVADMASPNGGCAELDVTNVQFKNFNESDLLETNMEKGEFQTLSKTAKLCKNTTPAAIKTTNKFGAIQRYPNKIMVKYHQLRTRINKQKRNGSHQ